MTNTVRKKPRKSAAKSQPNISVVPDVVASTNSNAALIARREAAVARGVASAAPIFAHHAENAELWDVEGNRFVDFAGGISSY